MYKYFINLEQKSVAKTIPPERIAEYREALLLEMERMGATNEDISLICDVMIRNSIINERKPEDVAWAILQ